MLSRLIQNCFWLMVPLLVWNVLLGPKITQEAILSDSHSPSWLLLAENITRIFVFALPLLLPLHFKDSCQRTGLLIYILGTLIYFGTWIPLLAAPQSGWSQSALGLIAPRLTPLLPFLGIALISQTWLYAFFAVLFIVFHSIHGIQNLFGG